MDRRWAALSAAFATALLLSPVATRAQPLTKDQQKCAVLMAGRLRGVVATRGKDALGCLKAASDGRLGGALAGCIADDQPGKVATAQAKVGADFDRRCTGESRKPPGVARLPPFGVSDPDTVNGAAREHAAGLFDDVFGADLDGAVIQKGNDKDGASCQLRLSKALEKCRDARLREYITCVQAGFKNRAAPFASASDVAGCIGADPKGRAGRRCDLNAGKRLDAIRKTLDGSCIAKGVDPRAAFPGCGASDREGTHACLDRTASCRVCLAVTAAASLQRDCDTADDGQANLSCPPLSAAQSPFGAEVPAFLAGVLADRTSGVPGTVFNLRVETSNTTAPIVAYQWTGNDGFSSVGQTTQVSFTAPGLHPIDVTVHDDQGRTVTTGILLVVFDPSAPAPTVGSTITPSGGLAGTLVQLTSPALLDPDAVVSVTIGGAPPVEPFRPALGTANIVIPFTADDGIGGPTIVPITLLADGVVADGFEFAVSPPPSLPGAPGDLTRQVFQAVPPLVTQLRGALPADIAAALTEDERGVLRGSLDVALIASQELRDRALALMGQLDAPTLTAIDQTLVANGIDPGFQAPATAASATYGVAALPGESLLEGCCLFHDVNGRLQTAMGALRFAAPLVALAGLAGGPVSGPILVGFANAALQLGIVGDIASLLAKIIPKVDDQLIVTTSLSRIPPGSQEPAIIRVKGKLVFDIDLCRDALDGMIAELAKATLARSLPLMPFSDFAREVMRRTMNADLNVRNQATSQVFQELSDFLAAVINRLAAGIVDISGINDTLKNAKVKICNQFQNLEVPIQPTTEIVRLPFPTNAGSLGPYNPDNVHFTCNPGFAGTATIRVVYKCGLHDLEGEVKVTCGEETCAEDAAADILPTVTQLQFLDQGIRACENTPFPPHRVFTRTAGIRFQNLNPTRTVAISFVIKDTTNAPRFDRPPCMGSECDNVVGRCFVFLPPGATSPEAAYNCESVSNSPVVDGTSPCVSGPVMSTERVIAHATYCDFESSNKALFCEDVSRFLLETETPHASFAPIERACP